jgi:hypothetical protein
MAIERIFFHHQQIPTQYYNGEYRVTDDFDEKYFVFDTFRDSIKEIFNVVVNEIPDIEQYRTLFQRTYVTLTNGLLSPGKRQISRKNLELLLKENSFESFSSNYCGFVKELLKEV